jgi:cellulose synthase/poly-beta-1,6-N-acetylglucosamine synthase-like glycosyltransferase
VSIILPARNEEKYIKKCLDSLIVQDYPNYEIIAINDFSSDKTGEIIKKYGINHSKVTYFEMPPKPRGGQARIGHVIKDILNLERIFFFSPMQIVRFLHQPYYFAVN